MEANVSFEDNTKFAPVFSPILFLFSSAWHILVKALCKVKGLFRENVDSI